MIDAAPTSESWGKAVPSIVPERRKGRIQSSPSHRVPYGYLVSNESSPGRSKSKIQCAFGSDCHFDSLLCCRIRFSRLFLIKGPHHHKKNRFWWSHVRLRESPSPLGPSNNTCHRNPYLYNTGGSLSGEEGISSTNFFFVGLFGTLGSAGPHGAGEPSVPNHGPVDPCRIFGANKKRGR